MNRFICYFVAAIICIAVVIGLLFVFRIGVVQGNADDTLLFCSSSPNGKITLEVYRVEAGATVDFSIKVYRIQGTQKVLIYNAYHEYEATIQWVNDNIVRINGRELNLSQGETYDWRN